MIGPIKSDCCKKKKNKTSWEALHLINRYLSSWKGILAQAKNGNEQFWKEKFCAASGKAQHALMDSPVFFLFERVGERGEGFFFFFFFLLLLFLMCFHHVPLRFSSSSQRILKFPMCS